MKKVFSSIRVINAVIILFIIYFDTSFFMIEGLRNHKITFMVVNIFVIFIWYYLNYKFEKDSEVSNEKIQNLIDLSLNYDNKNIEEEKKLLSEKLKYKENEKTYSLFKRMYVRKNLLKRDYNDIKEAYLKFIPKGFYDKYISKDGSVKISLGLSMKKHYNVMFLDIVGFTSLTEKIDSEKSLLLLNIYFDGIVDIVKGHGGYVDKFLGDGILVIFDQDNSDSSINAAIEIQNFMSKFQVYEIGSKIAVGIGINTGDVILGTVGSRDRMEVTVIGDVVNTAARLEHLTRETNTFILVSEDTYDCIKNKNHYTIHDLGMFAIDGKKIKKHLYSIDPVMSVSLKEQIYGPRINKTQQKTVTNRNGRSIS